MVFADLVGSTALAARLDPEETHGVLKAFQDAAAGEIARFEGHVAKFMGDGVLAYFGWPRAHEDEAERAVRAALAMNAAVGRLKAPDGGGALACRAGIATGLVVVGDLIGEGAAQEEAVAGEAPNLAARLQQIAEPGAVVVAEATRRLLWGRFEFDELETPALKGMPGRVRSFRVRGESPVEGRFETSQFAGPTPLVGRTQELALLLDRWETAKNGEGQVVLLVGEPGIGKSRIALAARERLRQERRISLRYFGSPYHTETALWPMVQQLGHAAGFGRDDTSDAKLDKLEALVARVGQDPAAAAPVLAQLMGLPGERYPPLDVAPPVLRARSIELLLAQFEELARQQPVLITLEDAHWLDPTTREVFDRVVDRIQALPVLLVVTARPEFASRWPSYAHVTVVSLNRLGARQAAGIVERVCGGEALPPALVRQILARADGVPLFVEELTKAVLEAGLPRDAADGATGEGPLPAPTVPATLYASLMARLDRLNLVKELAQAAACIGRAFSRELVAAVLDLDGGAVGTGLDRLVAAGLIHPRGDGSGGSYAFKHALCRNWPVTASSRPAAASCIGGLRRAWRRSGPATPRASRRSSPITTRKPAWPGARPRSASRPGASPRSAATPRARRPRTWKHACAWPTPRRRPARTSVLSPATRRCCSVTWRAWTMTWIAPTAAMTGRSRWPRRRRNAGSSRTSSIGSDTRSATGPGSPSTSTAAGSRRSSS